MSAATKAENNKQTKRVECAECGETEIKHILEGEDERYLTVFVCGHRALFFQSELDGKEHSDWVSVSDGLPEINLPVEVRGDYTPDTCQYPKAIWDGKKWSSREWRRA